MQGEVKLKTRNQALRPFSEDHHASLVLARRAAQACAAGTADAALAREVAASFLGEIDPHLYAEEQRLLPLMQQAGDTEHGPRTLREHAELRALARRLADGELAALSTFAEALRTHIRYEERELFARAEVLLGPALLARLAAEWLAE